MNLGPLEFERFAYEAMSDKLRTTIIGEHAKGLFERRGILPRGESITQTVVASLGVRVNDELLSMIFWEIDHFESKTDAEIAQLILNHLRVDPPADIRKQPGADKLVGILEDVEKNPTKKQYLCTAIEDAHNAGVPHDTIITILGEIMKAYSGPCPDYVNESAQGRMRRLGFGCRAIGKLFPGYHSGRCHRVASPGSILLPESGPDESRTVVYSSGCRTTFEEALKDHERCCLAPEVWGAYARYLPRGYGGEPPFDVVALYREQGYCDTTHESDLQAIANKYGGAFQKVDIPPPPHRGNGPLRYYWARGNAKCTYLALLDALRRCGIHLYADLRRLLYYLIVGSVNTYYDETWVPWIDGKWSYERKTWSEDRKALLARIVSKLQTFDYEQLRMLAVGHKLY